MIPTATGRLVIVAYGVPAPQGSKRHVGNGVMVESSAKVKPWREDVAWAARQVVGPGWQPLDEPLDVSMAFYLARPKAARKRLWPDVIPDLSKLIRSTEDALTTSGVWRDDKLVVRMHPLKLYAGPGGLPCPGAVIVIRPAGTPPALIRGDVSADGAE